MHETRSVTEVARHLADYINRVVERFVLVRGNKPVAELGPLLTGRHLAALPDLLAFLPRLSEVEAAEFADPVFGTSERLDRHFSLV